MVNGVFAKKSIWNKITLFCGLFLIGLTLYIAHQDPQGELFDVLILLGAGILIAVVSGVFLLLNHNAFLSFADGKLKGKYHYFGKIDCHISDVEFVQAQLNALVIQLKDGTVHQIMGIVNPWDFVCALEPRLDFQVRESAEELKLQLNDMKHARKREIIFIACLWGLMMLSIFVTVFLTDGKETSEFLRRDWSVFWIMCGVGFSAFMAMFYFAKKAGKRLFSIEVLTYRLRRTVIETTPLLPGNAVKVFAGRGFYARVIVFGYPNDDGTYYSGEELDRNKNLVEVYRSEVYEKLEWLMDDLDEMQGLIDITDKFIETQTAQ